MKKLVILGAAIALAAVGTLRAADEPAKRPATHKAAAHQAKMEMATPDELKWGDAPPMLASGLKLAVVEGNPNASSGYFTVMLKMPDGYKIMPHWHPTTERVTVISGELHAGMGDKLDEAGAKTFPPGGFVSIPAHMHHYAFAKGETVVEVAGSSPFRLVYVNAADDPSGMQGKKKPGA